MSGRGRGGYRGRGRGGRGHGGRSNYRSGQKNYRSGSDNNNNRNRNEEERKKVFEPHFAGRQHTDTYDSVKEQIVIQVQKSFKDQHVIVERIRNEDEKLGALKPPTLKKADFYEEDGTTLKKGKAEMDAKLEQEEYNMIFREEL